MLHINFRRFGEDTWDNDLQPEVLLEFQTGFRPEKALRSGVFYRWDNLRRDLGIEVPSEIIQYNPLLLHR